MHRGADAGALILATLALVVVGSATAPTVSADHGGTNDPEVAASAHAGPALDCAPDDAGAKVVCEASVDWLGAVDCTGFCQAEFGSPTGAALEADHGNREAFASGYDECGYSLNGCSIEAHNDTLRIESDGAGCFGATLEVETLVVADKLVSDELDSAYDSAQVSDSACT